MAKEDRREDMGVSRKLIVVAGLAWLVVAASGLRWVFTDDGDGWEGAYLAYSAALLVGAVAGVAAAARTTDPGGRRLLRGLGLLVSAAGCAASVLAWALVLWMPLLGVGLALVALSTASEARRGVAWLAASQLFGLLVLAAGTVAEIGRRDEWGDYPAAAGLALLVTAAVTVAGLARLTAAPRSPAHAGA
jgi:hypothetical protein